MRKIAISLLALVLMLTLVGCGQEALIIDQDAVQSVAVSSGNAVRLIDDRDVVFTLIDAINQRGFKPNMADESSLPTEQYRLTFYDDTTPTVTVTVFSEELIQADTTLYKGDASLLCNMLADYFAAEKLEDISDVFREDYKDIAEIAMHNQTKGRYKVVTRPTDCKIIFDALKSCTIVEKTDVIPKETYVFYIRTTEGDAYESPIILEQDDKTAQLICDGKILSIKPANWSKIFTDLAVNTMPIPTK